MESLKTVRWDYKTISAPNPFFVDNCSSVNVEALKTKQVFVASSESSYLALFVLPMISSLSFKGPTHS